MATNNSLKFPHEKLDDVSLAFLEECRSLFDVAVTGHTLDECDRDVIRDKFKGLLAEYVRSEEKWAIGLLNTFFFTEIQRY